VLHLTISQKVSATRPCLALSVTFHYGYLHSQTFTNLNARLTINPNFTVPKTEGTLAQLSVRVGFCIRVGRIADCTGQDSYTGNILAVSTSTGEQHKDSVIFMKLHTAVLRMRRQTFRHLCTLVLILIALCSLAWGWGSFESSCRLHLETKRRTRRTDGQKHSS